MEVFLGETWGGAEVDVEEKEGTRIDLFSNDGFWPCGCQWQRRVVQEAVQ